MSKKEPVIVYWSPYSNPHRVSYVNLLCDPPKKVLTTIGSPVSDKKASYHNCRSLQNLMKNTYMISAPLSSKLKISGSFEEPFLTTDNNLWNARSASLDKRYSVDYDFSWIFFSEEQVTLRETHPYMHNTSFSKSGYLASGSFEINKWFRPINITFNLWEDHNSIEVVEKEPLCYIEFETLDNRPVILKQFELTEDMYNYCTQALITSKKILSFESLESLYSRFVGSNRHKKIAKLIKENLL